MSIQTSEAEPVPVDVTDPSAVITAVGFDADAVQAVVILPGVGFLAIAADYPPRATQPPSPWRSDMPLNDPIQGITDLPTYTQAPDIPAYLQALWNAVIQRANPRWTTTAERDTAYPSPVEGQEAWAGSAKWIRIGSSWVRQADRQYAADISFTAATATSHEATVTFPSGRFSATPVVKVSLLGTTTANMDNLGCYVYNVTSTSCVVRMYHLTGGSFSSVNRRVSLHASVAIS